jgi:hypothetical protein
MGSTHADWQRATKVALEAYQASLRSGCRKRAAFDVALASARSVVPMVSEFDIREALSSLIAEKRLTAMAGLLDSRERAG